MWFPITLLLLAGVAVATPAHEHAWEAENEYQYLVVSRTLTGLDKLKEQWTGFQLKGILTIKVKSPELLLATLTKPQYAHIHKTLLNGPESEISDQMLEYRPIPMSEKPFTIKLKHGVIRDLLVDRDVPTWELNILKSFVSQLQIDTQGENAIDSKSLQFPVDEHSSVMFRAMEDSVGGKCEVLYDIMPLSDNFHEENPDVVPLPLLRGNGRYFDVTKVKNYERCLQRQLYRQMYHLRDPFKKENLDRETENLSQLSTTKTLISGNLKRFTIQSATMRSHISVKDKLSEPLLGTVHCILKLSLVKKSKLSSPLIELESNNLESTGNLVYTYNNPFSESVDRKERPAAVVWNSAQILSSESSSSQSSNENSLACCSDSKEEKDVSNLQPVAPVHKAPYIPLLPLFVGYKGKSITMSNVDVVERIQDMITEIADELQTETFNQNTLEKYTIVINTLRTMNHQQYIETEDRLSQNKDKSSQSRYNKIRNIYHDVVTQAGTGPALETIKDWIKSKKVEGVVAAEIISKIPKKVHRPSPEYLKAFFEMLHDSTVIQQRYVNVSAPIAFGQLLYNAYVSQVFKPKYLDHTPEDSEIINKYIPYLATQLEQSFSENNSEKIQTYIVALGVTGHPNILSVFEPYLEGTKPASKFQRLMIVSSLTVLGRVKPNLVGPVFYKLYLNPHENHEIRCLAVQRYILTNPSIIMLQRIAKNTYVEKNEHVNSAITTTIESIAETKREQWQSLASKARSVRNLLNPAISRTSSRGYYKDIDKVINAFSLQSVASDDSIIPIFLHFSIHTLFDAPISPPYLQPTVVFEYAVSSIRQFINKIKSMNWQEPDVQIEELHLKTRVDKIVEALNIKSENVDKLEGNIWLNTIYNFQFYPFESNTVEKIPNTFRNIVKKDFKMESTVFNNYEKTVSFPSENGVPFIFTYEEPVVIKVKAELTKNTPAKTRTGKIGVILINKVQKRLGFVTPFDHQNYITGIDENRMLQVPLEYELNLDTNKRDLELKIRPNLPKTQTDSQIEVLHYSTVPFTTRQDILDLQPLSHNKNMHLVLTSRPLKTMIGKDLFSLQVESDCKELEEVNLENNVAKLWKLQKLFNCPYKKLDLVMDTDVMKSSKFHINIAYDNMEVDVNDNGQEVPEMMQDVSVVDWKPNSPHRRNQIKNIVSRDFKSGVVHVIDVNYNVPFLQKEHVFSVGLVNNDLNGKSKTYVYWNTQGPQEERKYEVCYIQETQNLPNTPLDFEYTLKHPPIDQARAEFMYGKTCKEGNKVVLLANATRNDELTEIIEKSKIAKQCLEDIQKGNRATPVCQRAIEVAQKRNQYELSFVNPNSAVQKVVRDTVDVISHWVPNVHINSNQEDPRDVIAVKVITEPSLNKIPKIELFTPEMNVIFPYSVDTTLKTKRLMDETMLQSAIRLDSCTLDKNVITTFDKRVYPVSLGPVRHVLLITRPQKDPNNPSYNIPKEMRTAVLAEDVTDYNRKITIILGNREIEMVRLNNRLQVVVDGEVVELSKRTYQDRQDGKIVFEMAELPDESVIFVSKRHGITVVFDGEHVQILVSDEYRNAVRGLCGNYDSDPSTDFLTPKNCVLTRAEQFAATYALIQENSQGPVVENKRKAELAQCTELLTEHNYHRNVISDREAGRTLLEDKNWGYHQDNRRRQSRLQDVNKVNLEDRLDEIRNTPRITFRTRVVEEGDEVCFTTRPVPMCIPGTRPTDRKLRRYQLYCQSRNEESLELKHRIEQGANPDLSLKPTTKSHVFQTPVACRAA